MNALWLTLGGIVVAATLIAVHYAMPILANGSAFSSPGSLPRPGRHFARRLKRWWRSAAEPPAAPPAAPPPRLRAWPMLDLKAGRLAGLLLEECGGGRPAATTMSAVARLERAVSHGRRLGWRHSSTAVIVPVAGLAALLADPRGSIWETLERYSGDAVTTVPPLVLLVEDPADLPAEAILARLAQIRVEIALVADPLPDCTLPAAVERVFVKTRTALAAAERVEALQAPGRHVIVTGVPDMARLERLAKAGLRFATGPVFGPPQSVG